MWAVNIALQVLQGPAPQHPPMAMSDVMFILLLSLSLSCLWSLVSTAKDGCSLSTCHAHFYCGEACEVTGLARHRGVECEALASLRSDTDDDDLKDQTRGRAPSF